MAFEMSGPTFFKKKSPIEYSIGGDNTEDMKQNEIVGNMSNIIRRFSGFGKRSEFGSSWFDKLFGGRKRQEAVEDTPTESVTTDYAMGSPEWHKARKLKRQKEDLLG